MFKFQRKFKKNSNKTSSSPIKSSNKYSNLMSIYETSGMATVMRDTIDPNKRTTTLPWPKPEILRTNDDPFSTYWIHNLTPFLSKLAEWTFIYLIIMLGFGYSWIVLLAVVYGFMALNDKKSVDKTIISKISSMATEKEALGNALENFPSWVNFPDFERVEWINDILKQLWPSLDGYATTFVLDFIEPEIKRILDRMQLETVSGFQIKKVAVGSIPARLGGIKVYSKNVSRNEIILDAEVLFNGDARVLFTLQGVQAEIKNINFKGMARIVLKPIINWFPFIGGFEFYFLNSPNLNYGLGGIGTFASMPGANAIVKAIVEDQIRSRFVWPNKFHLYLPLDIVQNEPDRGYVLSKPAGILEIVLHEARDLLRKDKYLTGSGQSDPYAILTIGERQVSFREKFAPKTVNPVWNYSTFFVIEDSHGQELKIDVYDYDNSTTDDYLGSKNLDLSQMIDKEIVDDWLHLDGVKHGEIHIGSRWIDAEPVHDHFMSGGYSSYIISIFINYCTNLGTTNKSPYSKCMIRHAQNDIQNTQIKNKTRNPKFEESFLFFSKTIDTDHISMELIDTKTDSKLGWVKLPFAFVKECPRSEFFDMDWKLEDANEDASINLSAKLYGLKT